MNTENNKKLDGFIAGLIKDISTDTTSPGFTDRLMTQVHLTELHKSTIYKPLISKKGWFFITGCIFALATYLVLNANHHSDSLINYLGISVIYKNFFNSISSFKFSNASLYAIIVLFFLLFVQITFIKQFLNKRLQG